MPTQRQKEAFDKMVENGGIISQAMIDAGYSENTAHTPQKLTESKGWMELMEEHIPNRLLAEKHKALLNKSDEEGNIDVQAVSKGLDMAYKIKGLYDADETKRINVLIPVLVKFLDKKDDTSSNGDTDRIP